MFLLLWVMAIAVSDAAHDGANYASSLAGSRLMEYNKVARGAHNILLPDAEKYLILPCSEPHKSVTIQLSREVVPVLVALRSVEYFSSTIRSFELQGSTQFPCIAPCKWLELGVFEANFSRERQLFVINISLPIRYVGLLWKTHHGDENLCTLTDVEVYGTNVIEQVAAELVGDAMSIVFSTGTHEYPEVTPDTGWTHSIANLGWLPNSSHESLGRGSTVHIAKTPLYQQLRNLTSMYRAIWRSTMSLSRALTNMMNRVGRFERERQEVAQYMVQLNIRINLLEESIRTLRSVALCLISTCALYFLLVLWRRFLL